MMNLLRRRALAGPACLLLLGLLIPMIPTSAAPGDDEKPAALPADLALVPADALWFSTFRVGDIFGSEDAKKLLPILQMGQQDSPLQVVASGVGLKGGDIERLTLVSRRMYAAPVWIVRTAKPVDKEAVLKRLGLTDEVKVSGKTIVTGKARSKFGPSEAVWLPDDRTIVKGSPDALVPYLAALARPGKAHALAEGLEAASSKHAVVVALRPSMMFRSADAESHEMRGRWEKDRPKDKMKRYDYDKDAPKRDLKKRYDDDKDAPKRDLKKRYDKDEPPPPPVKAPRRAPPRAQVEGPSDTPPPARKRAEKGSPAFDPAGVEERPLKLRSIDDIVNTSNEIEMRVILPLLHARRALLTIDLGDEIRAKARAEFGSADEAKDGEVVARMGQYLLREMVPAVLAKELRLDRKEKVIADLFAKFKAAVRAGEVKRDGKVVEATLATKFDPAPLIAYVREVAPIRIDENNLKQLGLAFHMYHDTMGFLPPPAICDKAGKPLLSWRVAILPYIEQDRLYRQFKLDEAWDSPHNKKLLDKMPKIYSSPSGKADEPNATFYQVFTGPKTLYPRPDSKVGLGRIIDGSSNTLMVVEANKAVPWTKPADIAVPAKGKLPKLGGQFAKFFNAAFCDGSVRRIRLDFDEEDMRNVIDPADGKVLNDKKLNP